MIKSHVVFPGAFAAYIETAEKILSEAEPKPGSGIDKLGVETKYYGGGYVSDLESAIYYYFQRGNQLNWGYDISLTDSLRTEDIPKGGYLRERKELNHFYHNYTDRKLFAILNVNERLDESTGGLIYLHTSDGYQEPLDDIFYKKKGSAVIIDVFTKYSISTVKTDNPVRYITATCSGTKFI